jgi:nitroreductase
VIVALPESYSPPRLPEDEALARSRAHLATMWTRRSVRHFAPDPVSRELIENALRVAGSAPSGANQQPWTFVVVTDEETKQRIRDGAEREEQLLYDERATDEYLRAIEPIGTDASKPHLTDAPYLIAVFEQAWRYDESGAKRKHYYVRESVGIAVGFLLTALHTAGLATLTHAPSPMGFLKEILGRPENERPFLLIPVGYPAADATVPELTKKQLDEFAQFV